MAKRYGGPGVPTKHKNGRFFLPRFGTMEFSARVRRMGAVWVSVRIWVVVWCLVVTEDGPDAHP